MSLHEIHCPMCKGTIYIDPSTMKIVDHKSSDQPKADFSAFLQSQKNAKPWDDKFRKAKEEETRRKSEIDQKFKQAREHPDQLGDDDVRPPVQWD